MFCQVEMRKLALEYSDSDIDLYQWFKGSKFCTVSLETLVTLVEDDDGDEYIEVKIRGPRQSSKYCFYFFEQIIATISQVSPNHFLPHNVCVSRFKWVLTIDFFGCRQFIMCALVFSTSVEF